MNGRDVDADLRTRGWALFVSSFTPGHACLALKPPLSTRQLHAQCDYMVSLAVKLCCLVPVLTDVGSNHVMDTSESGSGVDVVVRRQEAEGWWRSYH